MFPLLSHLSTAIPGARALATPIVRGARGAIGVPRYVDDWRTYRALPGAEPLRVRDAFPQLLDRTATTPYDAHYFHQAIWAARHIAEDRPEEHVDVGSLALFVGMLAVTVPVTFIDIRPLDADIPNLRCVRGSLERLPLADRSVASLSCLHVVEHIGLGATAIRSTRTAPGVRVPSWRVCSLRAAACTSRLPSVVSGCASTPTGSTILALSPTPYPSLSWSASPWWTTAEPSAPISGSRIAAI